MFSRSLLLSIQDTGSMVPVLLPGFDEFELTIQNVSVVSLENDTVVITSFPGAKAVMPYLSTTGTRATIVCL